jgi:hypothetical protein
MSLNSSEQSKKIELYQQEIQKKNLCEKLLSLKVDIEQELQTQVQCLL